jgi:hypothetical protein
MSEKYYTPDEIEVEGMDAVTLYRWGDRMVDNYFCKTCGIYVFHCVTAQPGSYRVNLGCVDGIDPLAVEITLIDGRSF